MRLHEIDFLFAQERGKPSQLADSIAVVKRGQRVFRDGSQFELLDLFAENAMGVEGGDTNTIAPRSVQQPCKLYRLPLRAPLVEAADQLEYVSSHKF